MSMAQVCMTFEQRKSILIWHLKFGNISEVQRDRRQQYGTESPTRLRIADRSNKFETDGTIKNIHKGRSSRPLTSTSEVSSAGVLYSFTRSPQKLTLQSVHDDMVCLQCTATGERVCLAAEGFGNRHCFLENIADKNTPPEMSSCVFVIEQALSVRALQEMVTAMSSESGKSTQSGHRTLLYGHAVLLRHQNSNMYLACLSTSSSNDKLAFDVGLQEHSQGEACWWTIHPASKQRSEGEKVRVGDDLILVSVATERYLHTAREGTETIVNASFHLTHWSVAPFGTGSSRVKSVATDHQNEPRATKSVSHTTIQRILLRLGVRSRRLVRAPMLTAVHRRRRLEFARQYSSWTSTEWRHVAFLDESRFMLHRTDGRWRIRRETSERNHPATIAGTVQARGWSIMVWGMFSWHSLGSLIIVEGTMDQYKYASVLGDHVHQYMRIVFPQDDGIFQQDNARCHTAASVRAWFEEHQDELTVLASKLT
ncbi:ryanodine receptor [Trichonephila clavipes]|nr:ryanodine receptor [Trichonephila clavipes]